MAIAICNTSNIAIGIEKLQKNEFCYINRRPAAIFGYFSRTSV